MTQYASRFDEWVTPWAALPRAPLFSSSAPAPVAAVMKAQPKIPMVPKKAPLNQSGDDAVASPTTVKPATTVEATQVSEVDTDAVSVKTMAIAAISISCILLLALLIYWVKSSRDAEKARVLSNRILLESQTGSWSPSANPSINYLTQFESKVDDLKQHVDSVNYVIKALLVNSPWLKEYVNYNKPNALEYFGNFSVV
jgi:hypothetical protein